MEIETPDPETEPEILIKYGKYRDALETLAFPAGKGTGNVKGGKGGNGEQPKQNIMNIFKKHCETLGVRVAGLHWSPKPNPGNTGRDVCLLCLFGAMLNHATLDCTLARTLDRKPHDPRAVGAARGEAGRTSQKSLCAVRGGYPLCE